MKKAFLTLLSYLFIMNNSLFAQTNIMGGDVSGIWSIDKSPFLIHENIIIPNDSTLVIDPGVVVEFQGHYSMNVQGRLLAIGTETDTILFTVSDTTEFSNPDTTQGGWYGIRFLDTPLNNDSSKIEYCCLEYGKAVAPVWHLYAGGAICILQFGKVVISNCLIRNNFASSTSDEQAIAGGLYFFKSDITVKNTTFKNNYAYSGGAIYFDESNPTFMNNIFENNSAVNGGGISIGGISNPTFTNDEFKNNVAESHGGGLLFWEPSVVEYENIKVIGNKAQWGAGIGVQGGELRADNCLFADNRAEIWGGGVACDFGKLSFQDCSFTRDTSIWGSGGLHMDNVIADISNCLFEENNAVFGGGFHTVFSKITCNQNNFINNTADGGGALHAQNSDCIITNCRFEGNSAINGNGGAIDYEVDSTIFDRSYILNFSKTEIVYNNASGIGGGVRIEQLASDTSMIDIVIDSCNFIGNHSDIFGSLRLLGFIKDFTISKCLFGSNTTSSHTSGPAFANHASGNVYNSVFYANYSQFSDSTKIFQGATLQTEAEVDFVNCTFTDTSSVAGIGLSLRRGAKTNVTNCIFWKCGNRPLNLVTVAELGCTALVEYCNIEYGADSIFISDETSQLSWGEGNINKDPYFVNPFTTDLHLSDTSECIGAGILNDFNLNQFWSYDIEGNIRPNPLNSNPDLGAYENELGTPVINANKHVIGDNETKLFQNYPNPFQNTTTITYQLSSACNVKLNIFNISGQKIKCLVSEKKPEGKYSIIMDMSAFESGQYFYKLQTNTGWSQTRKLILMK